MKTLIKQIALFVILVSSYVLADQLRGLPITPKAIDLTDHFGTEPVKNIYGPKAKPPHVDLAREGILGAATPITPILNFEREIIPTQVVAGDLDNTSYDASLIIRPEIAVPKFNIRSNFVHEAIIKTPVHIGTQFETHSSQSMNRVTGQVARKHTTIEKPIIGLMKNVRQVTTDTEHLVNINTGRLINMTKRTEMHGIDPLSMF